MNASPLLVATRSADKLREIREILTGYVSLHLLSLVEADIPEHPDEDGLECFDTFRENALAKARFFAYRSGLQTLADDSGLCVDALNGAPGVRSKRFAAESGLHGVDLDRANNALLLEQLRGRSAGERSAHYVCAIALVEPSGEARVYTGTCHGVILTEPRGTGGFGYDPLFFLPEEGATFGELPPERKNQLSHRASALRALGMALRDQVDGSARSR